MTISSSHFVAIAYTIFGVGILLGCAQTKEHLKPAGDRINASFKRAVDPLDDLFGNKKKTTTTNKKEDKEEDKEEDKKAQDAAKSVQNQDLFFDVPSNWTIVKFVETSKRYQLKHDTAEGASLVITYQKLDPSLKPEQRQERLRQTHQALISRLPESYKKQEYREWNKNNRPHILTALKGKKKEDAPEVTIMGYSVAVDQYDYIIFAAFPSTTSLSSDIESVVKSLRTVPEPQKTTEPAKPADEKTDTAGEAKDDTKSDDTKREEDTIQNKPSAPDAQ